MKSLKPSRNFSILALAFAFTLALTPACWGQYDIFLKVQGVDGESTDTVHRNEIDGTGFSFGVSTTTTIVGGGGGAGRATFADLSVTKYVDKASPLLMVRCASGAHINSVVLTVRSTSPSSLEYYKVTLTDVIVKRLETGGSVGGKPTETVSFNYGKIEIIYTPRNANGTPGTLVRGGWDLVANTSF